MLLNYQLLEEEETVKAEHAQIVLQ